MNYSTIVILTHARHSAKDIVKLTKLPKATVHVFKLFKEESKADRKEHKTQSDSKHTPRFLTGLKRSIEANPSTTTLAKKHNMSLSTETLACLAMFEDTITSLQPRPKPSELRDAQSFCHSLSIKVQEKFLYL